MARKSEVGRRRRAGLRVAVRGTGRSGPRAWLALPSARDAAAGRGRCPDETRIRAMAGHRSQKHELLRCLSETRIRAIELIRSQNELIFPQNEFIASRNDLIFRPNEVIFPGNEFRFTAAKAVLP